MPSETRKFRVAIVTIWEVESTDFRDAANVAEGAAHHALGVAVGSSSPPTVTFSRRGNIFKARPVATPGEISRVTRAGHVNITVEQPTESEERW